MTTKLDWKALCTRGGSWMRTTGWWWRKKRPVTTNYNKISHPPFFHTLISCIPSSTPLINGLNPSFAINRRAITFHSTPINAKRINCQFEVWRLLFNITSKQLFVEMVGSLNYISVQHMKTLTTILLCPTTWVPVEGDVATHRCCSRCNLQFPWFLKATEQNLV
jgi:hypothetical protein